MKHVVACEFSGCVNNAPVEVVGQGTVDAGQLRLELVARQEPLHWDRALILPCCLDNLLLLCLPEAPAFTEDPPLYVHGRTTLFDDQGRAMGQATSIGLLRLERGAIRLRAQFLEAAFQLELLEQITRLEAPCCISVMPFGDAKSIVTSAWAFETNRGSSYWATTTSLRAHPVCTTDATPVLLRVESLSIARDAAGKRPLRLNARVGCEPWTANSAS